MSLEAKGPFSPRPSHKPRCVGTASSSTLRNMRSLGFKGYLPRLSNGIPSRAIPRACPARLTVVQSLCGLERPCNPLAYFKLDKVVDKLSRVIVIDKPFTTELRDAITRELRSKGFKVQWRKWGFLVEDGIHIDINYAPLTLDEEFMNRSHVVAENLLLPSLEDLVVLKLMSGERKDIDDVKKILSQAWHMLDKEYLYKRVQQAGLERELKKTLRRLKLE